MEARPFTPVDAVARLLARPVANFVVSHLEDLGHLAWYAKHIEDYKGQNLKHIGNCVYLDYAGAALYSRAQLLAASAAMLDGLFANPHTSQATGDAIARVRSQVLQLFGTSSASHTLVFTAGATHGLQLLGENYAWSQGACFLYAQESHTSVVGLRQYALHSGVDCGTFMLQDLPTLCENLARAEALEGKEVLTSYAEAGGTNLIAFSGESNFSGVRGDLDYITALRAGPMRWRVLLDAAKLACSPGSLDLSRCSADFVAISFYKMFGYPTGLGALIVRHDAAPLLTPRGTLGNVCSSSTGGSAYFGGGCVSAISATSDFAVPRPSLSEWLERGTSHFLGIAALPSQMDAVRALGTDEMRRRHVLAVCREAYLRMIELRHNSGQKLCTIFGRHDERDWHNRQGPTIACILHFSNGSPVPYGLVDERASAKNIMLRTGCLCNPGDCQRCLGITNADIQNFFASGKVCGDNLGIIDGRPVGVVRLSFGLFSTLSDVTQWISLLKEEFLNRSVEDENATCIPAAPCEVASSTANVLKQFDTGDSICLPSVPTNVRACAQSERNEFPSHPQASESSQLDASASGEIVALKIYPIKGCGPLDVKQWPLDESTGALFLDRRWCVSVPVGSKQSRSQQRLRPVSAKQAPQLTQVHISLASFANRDNEDACDRLALVLKARSNASQLVVPLADHDAGILRNMGEVHEVIENWDSSRYIIVNSAPENGGQEVSKWFESLLGISNVTLVEAARTAGTGEAPSASTHFANAPSTLLLVSTASLREFGRVCGLAAPANRFRANLEVNFDKPFVENEWMVADTLNVGELAFETAGRCVRCQAVDVDPDTGEAEGPSLLAALATSQHTGGKGKGPTFGVLLRLCQDIPINVVPSSMQMLAVGMRIRVPETRQHETSPK